ncbi:hypothetical protein HMSSN036_86360 [Paenibacillus macerans]|nr:hypothetical protein HMSSN036_86360 [Paenibacillus macerans]
MDGCPKAEGIMMMIRSMSPDVLIVDEIGRPEDADALAEALHAGVRVICTAHGASLDDLSSRPALAKLSETGFSKCTRCLRGRKRDWLSGSGTGKRRGIQLHGAEWKGREEHA